jgi:hypothetical protein
MDPKELKSRVGIGQPAPYRPDAQTIQYINFRLSSLGLPTVPAPAQATEEWTDMVHALLSHQRETDRLLANYLPPVDWRIQSWLDEYLYDTGTPLRLPHDTFVLYRYGVARALSLPPAADEFHSPIIHTYRTKTGVLNNPAKDRRTTEGVFHVAEGGLPIPDDKKAVPLRTFALLLQAALAPPNELLRLPFASDQPKPAECFVSLLLRPTVVPAVPGRSPARSMEIRFFAPGNLVSNLDFVESIFGNAGDPFLPENDAGLDADHWTGHTGCVILAPHLVTLRKTELGLPHWSQATERQRRDGMCWKSEDELYNEGGAFKVTARDQHGVIVTLIADNYFGYCKKEVKTQISYAANLLGQAEEEHAGGALVFASFDLGEDFDALHHVRPTGHTYDDMVRKFAEVIDARPEGYAVDRRFPDIVYVPEGTHFDLSRQRVSWTRGTGPSRSSSSPTRPTSGPRATRSTWKSPRPPLAPRRHARRRHALPQTLHRLRRRQVRDLQVDQRRHPHRPRLRRRFREGLRRSSTNCSGGITPTVSSTARSGTTGRSSVPTVPSAASSSCSRPRPRTTRRSSTSGSRRSPSTSRKSSSW